MSIWEPIVVSGLSMLLVLGVLVAQGAISLLQLAGAIALMIAFAVVAIAILFGDRRSYAWLEKPRDYDAK